MIEWLSTLQSHQICNVIVCVAIAALLYVADQPDREQGRRSG